LQAWDLAKVCEIPREQRRIPGEHNGRNLQVHGSDPQPSTPELLEDNSRGPIKRQDRDPSVVAQMLQQPATGFDPMGHRARTRKIRHPAQHLFPITDDRGHHLCRGTWI
jgi:hypothetical protein